MKQTVAKHLHDLHLSAGEKCASCARLHKSISGHHEALASHFEVSNPTASELHKKLSADHSAMSDAFATEGEGHVAACKDLQSAMKAAGNEIEPMAIAANPTTDRVRVVPRAGQPTEADVQKAAGNADSRIRNIIGEVPA